jgi:hypothetical protein
MVMIVKEKFDLIRGIDNVLHMSKSEIVKASIENGPRKIFVVLELMKNRISHYTKDRIFNLVGNIKERDKSLNVVYLPNYPLPVSYNLPTKSIVINIAPFGIDDVETTKPGPFNLYALMVYSIVFGDLVSGKVKVTDKHATVIANYLVSVLIRLFGKQYGLLGSFSIQIPKLKFLINLYVLESFFGIKGNSAYKKASTASAYNFKEIVEQLVKYDFSNINNLILALSDFGIMPNMNRHLFAAKFLRFFGINVMPALEDCSRFVATLATSDIKGSNVISTHLLKYNEKEFGKVLEVSKNIFKRK